MAWVVGIDEAGYGPNLGPLLQAAVAVKLPDDDDAGWNHLRSIVKRIGEKHAAPLLIDDSKKVHSGKHGFARLHDGLAGWLQWNACNFAELLLQHGLPNTIDEIEQEAWYAGTEPIAGRQPMLAAIPEAGPVVVRLVHPKRFNEVTRASGSKATVLSDGLQELMQAMLVKLPGEEPIRFLCDKQGGRTYYAPFLQATFPDGWVHADFEKAEESRYRIENLNRRIVITFQPRADGASVSVALASMFCKYLRELCMKQFNAYWAVRVPGIKPTAGYPLDAKRFYAEIAELLPNLNLSAEQIWREK